MEKFLREKLINGSFGEVPPIRSKMMGRVKSQGNKSTELKFCNGLKEAGIFGWKLHQKLVGSPDILFPTYRVAIFLDGCFWHGCPQCGHIPKTNFTYWEAKIQRNIERDKNKSDKLAELGYLVIRFWEHELLTDLERCIVVVKEALEENLLKISNYEYWTTIF